jgi:hypothetical protein
LYACELDTKSVDQVSGNHCNLAYSVGVSFLALFSLSMLVNQATSVNQAAVDIVQHILVTIFLLYMFITAHFGSL